MNSNKDTEELEKDLQEQYAMLENEVQEDKKKKRFLLLMIFFLSLFLIMVGTTFSYFRIYEGAKKDCNLEELNIDGIPGFEFSPDVYTYVIKVPAGTKSIDFNYSIGCKNSEIIIEGNKDFKPGENIVKIKVIDSDGNEKEYIIYVIVEETETPADFGLKSLAVSNHQLDKAFKTGVYSYVVRNISPNEDSLNVDFKLLENTTVSEIRLNGSKVTRPITKIDDLNRIFFNVKSELLEGTNKLEIKVKDNNGNEKTYVVYLVVESSTNNNDNNDKKDDDKKDDNKDPKKDEEDIQVDVVQINVDYFGNDTAQIVSSEIVPGWKSANKQHIRITNPSNYNVKVKINWVDVSNNFTNTDDLLYRIYKDSSLVKSGTLPTADGLLIDNILVNANTVNDYFIEYEYKYRDEDQNIDQGKEFKASFSTSIQQ